MCCLVWFFFALRIHCSWIPIILSPKLNYAFPFLSLYFSFSIIIPWYTFSDVLFRFRYVLLKKCYSIQQQICFLCCVSLSVAYLFIFKSLFRWNAFIYTCSGLKFLFSPVQLIIKNHPQLIYNCPSLLTFIFAFKFSFTHVSFYEMIHIHFLCTHVFVLTCSLGHSISISVYLLLFWHIFFSPGAVNTNVLRSQLRKKHCMMLRQPWRETKNKASHALAGNFGCSSR